MTDIVEQLTNAITHADAPDPLHPLALAEIKKLRAERDHWEAVAIARQANLARMMDLIRDAFNEGFVECMNDVMWQSGGKVKPVRWRESRSRKRLAELKGQNDEKR